MRIRHFLQRALPLAALLSAVLPAAAQDVEDTSTAIFDPGFRTLKVSMDDDFFALPVLRPETDDAVVISFDEMTSDPSYLQYSIYQCDADWKPSQLIESEYLPGFNRGDVSDRALSSNTFQFFTNYRITVPDPEGNPDMMPTQSGNYLLKVYREFEPEETLLQARFQVSENTATISGEASAVTDLADGESQQLELTVTLPSGLRVTDPYSQILVVTEQNRRPQSRRVITRPLQIDHNRLIYRHNRDLLFPAGNEYRRFETVEALTPGMHTDSIRHIGRLYDAYLAKDERRADRQYLYDQTQRGRYLIRNGSATDSDLGADYIDTYFTLDMPEVIGADIYLDGEFTNHRADPRFRLEYDRQEHLYRVAVPLKQGSYNYQYVAVPHGGDGSQADPAVIEGNYPDTCNEYNVSVYLRLPGARTDRLLGTSTIIFQP